MNILTGLLLLSFTFSLSAKTCEEMKVRIIFDGKPVITKEVFCSKKTTDNMIFYISKSCVEDKCNLLKRKKSQIKIPDYFSNTGSPGFKLCSELGGVPQIFEFSQDSSLWQSTERCLLGVDFVEISLLSREWKKYILK